jgi:hypothetical protein
MATLTAVAAGGNWGTAATWSPAQVPTNADDVVLDATSGPVTVTAGAVCRSVDASSYTGTLTHNSATTWTIGSGAGGTAPASNIALAFSAAMTYSLVSPGGGSAIAFSSQTTGAAQTIDLAGKPTGSVTFSGASAPLKGTWKLLSAWTTSATATVTFISGTLDTNDQTCSWGLFSCSSGANRVLTLGASQITITGSGTAWNTGTTTGLTITANTATVTTTASSVTLNSGAGVTLPSTIITGSSPILGSATGSAPVFANLTWTPPASAGAAMQLNQQVNVSGTLTVTGNSRLNQALIFSSVLGTSRTLNVAGGWVLANVDIRDIAGAGAASRDFSAQNDIGDGWGNSGITFPTPLSLYRINESSPQHLFSDATRWSLTQGGAPDGRVPLLQDTALMVGASTGNANVLLDIGRVGTIDWRVYGGLSGAFGNPQPGVGGIAVACYGSWITDQTFSSTLAQNLNFNGRSGNYTYTEYNSRSGAVTINAPGATITLGHDLTLNGNSATVFTLTAGTFDSAGYAVTFNTANGRPNIAGGILNMGTSVWSIGVTASGTLWNATGGVVNGANATIIVTATATSGSRAFIGGGQTYGVLRYVLAGSPGGLIVQGNNTFDSIEFSDASNARTLTFSGDTTFTGAGIVGNGAAGRLLSLVSSSATVRTLSKASGTVTLDYWNISNSAATGGAIWQATNSVDGGGNTGWDFGVAAPIIAKVLTRTQLTKPTLDGPITIRGP